MEHTFKSEYNLENRPFLRTLIGALIKRAFPIPSGGRASLSLKEIEDMESYTLNMWWDVQDETFQLYLIQNYESPLPKIKKPSSPSET